MNNDIICHLYYLINRLFESQAKFCPLVVFMNSRVSSLRRMPYFPNFFPRIVSWRRRG